MGSENDKLCRFVGEGRVRNLFLGLQVGLQQPVFANGSAVLCRLLRVIDRVNARKIGLKTEDGWLICVKTPE